MSAPAISLMRLRGLVRKEGSAVIVSRAATGALAESIARLKARAEAFGA